MKRPYPSYDVLAKWDTPSFDETTRAVLAKRLTEVPPRRFFTEDEHRLLEAVADRLLPQSDRREPIPIAPWIDARLATDGGEGFRYDGMPPQQEAWRLGLRGIDAEARLQFSQGFRELGPGEQDEVLRRIEAGEVDDREWGGLDARRFFRHELLTAAVGVYYAHPAAWNEIGFGGPASPRGYVRLGFDERDPWEPELAR
jgi:hypothetical protein